MSMDDQSGDSDRTIVRPRPGKKRQGSNQPDVAQPAPAPVPPASASPFPPPSADFASSGAAPPPAFSQVPPTAHAEMPSGGGEVAIHGLKGNPLVDAATTLLVLGGQLRNMVSCPDVESLRARVIEGFRSFENSCRQSELALETVKPAHYSLCTFIDEVVLSTPWGSESGWSNSSLLSTFHNETWGGERFFQILNSMLQEPAKNLHYLEFSYLIIALGFEGKYGGLDQGMSQLEGVRTNLFATIRQLRGDLEQELSPRWRGVEDTRNALMRTVPLWVLASLSALLLLSIFLTYRYLLSDSSYPVYETLNNIGRYTVDKSALALPAEPQPVDETKPTLTQLLKTDIDAGALTVEQWQNQEIVRIQGDMLFRSGRVKIDAQHEPLLHRVADALNQLPGQVWVVGHSDNVPIRSLKWKSNWELSRARAANVLELLAMTIGDPARLMPDGRADTEPLAPNDTPANKARNRRVEIVLIAANSL